MTSKLSAVAVVVSLAFGFLAAQDQPRQIEEERTRTAGDAAIRLAVEQIRVDVTVQDRDGNLITGLEQGNFRVYEDKVEQEITYFEPVQAPMTTVLLTEYSKVLPWELLYEALMGSYVFIDQMRMGDWVAVVAYDMRPEILVDFTQDRGEVYQSLRKLNYPAYRESCLYDALWDTLDRIQELDQKTAVVVLSTGLDTFSKKNLGELLDRVKRANSVIYSVSLGQAFRIRYDSYFSSINRLDHLQGDTTLRTVAKYTGGASFFPRFTTEFPGIFQSIAALLRNQYSLGYVSSNTKKDGKYRKIKVEVTADVDGDGKPDKLKLNHREGFLAEKN
jgi:VWFA-related protein